MRCWVLAFAFGLPLYVWAGIGCEYCRYPYNLHKVDSLFVCDKHYCAKHDLIKPPLHTCNLCDLETKGLRKSKCVICGSRDQLMIRKWIDGGNHSGTEYVVICPYHFCEKHRFVLLKHDFTRKDKPESEFCCKKCFDERPRLKRFAGGSTSQSSINDSGATIPMRGFVKGIAGSDTAFAEDICRYIVSISTGESDITGFLLKMGDQVYLYTCWPGVYSPYPIVARDYLGRVLNLGDFELCRNRDVVRFKLALCA